MADKLTFRTDMDFAYGAAKDMAAGVLRIVANNPSPYTFKGTNSYLIGQSRLALIDPGPDDPVHLDAILRAANGRPITHIVITHTHSDHVAGLASAIQATGAKTAGFGPYSVTSRVATKGAGGEGGHGGQPAFRPDIRLSHGDRLDGGDWLLEAIHTPGHLPDHLCFALGESGIVFSGDHVMGWNTSVIAPPDGRMADYNRSLELLAARPGDSVYFPGHGGRVEQPQRVAKAYLLHRRMREQAIHDAIVEGASSIAAIVDRVYAGLDPRLVPAASMSVLAHIEHLLDRGLVLVSEPLSLKSALSSA